MPLHHFLPEFYLRQWFDPASLGQNRTPCVWKISRDGRTSGRRHPTHRDFAIEDGNMLESVTGERNETTERLLSRVEDILARTLRDAIPQRQALDQDQADAIKMFFSSMLVRVPSARTSLQQGVAAMARIQRETAEANELPAPDTRLFEQNALPHFTHSALVDILPELDKMTYQLLRTPAGESFLTSDRPAIIWSPIGFQGLRNRYCQAWLPLAPQVLLLVTHDEPALSGYYDVTATDVLHWNRQIVAHCSQWFISNRRESDPRWFAVEPS